MADHLEGSRGFDADLSDVTSLADFAGLCRQLRGNRTQRELEKAALPRALPKSTLSNLVNGKSVPTRDTMVSFLKGCGVHGAAQTPWLTAWERVVNDHHPRPDGAVRACEARPRMLGVHAAIELPGAHVDLPPYVERDLDTELRAAVEDAAAYGGFVLLVGGSCSGKSRTLYQAVQTVLPQWWLVHPSDTAAATRYADAPTPRTVLWLDELQNYLGPPAPLPFGRLRDLISAGTVVVGTLWPDEFATRTAPRRPNEADPYANDRTLLRLARVVPVAESFSLAERRRAEDLARGDERLRAALDATDVGVTQALAGAPLLVQWWEHAPAGQCYGKAVITAALDARRVGARRPVSREFLRVAAPAYLTSAQQAAADPERWLDEALDYATTELHGAAACLVQVAAGMGRVDGWTSADYLHQHAQRTRRTMPLPEDVWQALVEHHHPADTASLAESARLRGRRDEAIRMFRPTADAGDQNAARRLAELLAEDGCWDELRARADAGDWHASWELSRRLRADHRIDELRDRAASGDAEAVYELDEVLIEEGHLDQLQAHADASDVYACYLLVRHLAGHGQVDEAITILRARAGSAPELTTVLAELLEHQGQVEEAIALLRERAAAGGVIASHRLPRILADQGHVDEAIAMLREPVDAGERFHSHYLAQRLTEHGRVDEALDVLRKAAAAYAGNALKSDHFAEEMLPRLLAEHGRWDEIRQRADNGDRRCATLLTHQLAQNGELDRLRERSAAGDTVAAENLARRMAADGDVDGAIAWLRATVNTSEPAATIALAGLLADNGRVDEAIAELREHIGQGVYSIGAALIGLLIRHDRVEQLREEQAAGTRAAAEALRSIERGQPLPPHLRDSAGRAAGESPAVNTRMTFLFL